MPPLLLCVDFLGYPSKTIAKKSESIWSAPTLNCTAGVLVRPTGNWNQSINMDYKRTAGGWLYVYIYIYNRGECWGARPKVPVIIIIIITIAIDIMMINSSRSRSRSSSLCWLYGHSDWNSASHATPVSPWRLALCMSCNLTSSRLISSAQIWQKLMSANQGRDTATDTDTSESNEHTESS